MLSRAWGTQHRVSDSIGDWWRRSVKISHRLKLRLTFNNHHGHKGSTTGQQRLQLRMHKGWYHLVIRMTHALNYSQCEHSACSEPLISHINRSVLMRRLPSPSFSPTSFLTISFSSTQSMVLHYLLFIPGRLSRFKPHASPLHNSMCKIENLKPVIGVLTSFLGNPGVVLFVLSGPFSDSAIWANSLNVTQTIVRAYQPATSLRTSWFREMELLTRIFPRCAMSKMITSSLLGALLVAL